ncbi:MAG: hypothetical protein F6K40_05120, partial [Okeania sp. SIO3I5]|uniref:hypothetical protein n=1 Tax=Okeania sp. SIO3I5 TaxID=2607805 RepID=UPI0013BB1F46
MWIVRDSNYMRLSPFLVAIFAASTSFGISKYANAEVSEINADIDLISVSINSKTQFAKLFSTKSFLDLGSSFPEQQLFGSSKNFLSKSWSEAEVKLEFYSLLKVKEVTKSFYVYNKEFANFLALNVLEKTEIPQLTLINKSGEVKSEASVNQEFSPTISTVEVFENQTENSQSVILAKSGEVKSEASVNQEFSPSISTVEIFENQTENSQSVILAKSGEVKSEASVNQEFSPSISTVEVFENQTENSQSVILAKSGEVKSEASVN